MPAGAQAAPFLVTNTGDTGDSAINGTCVATGGGCTLRAAIQEANATVAPDTITFDSPPFNGSALTSVITAGTTLPSLAQPVTIDGDDCGNATVPQPCVEVNAASGGRVFIVTGDDVTLRGLAMSGDSYGVEATGGSQGLEVTGSWFGRRLNGDLSGLNTGIRIDETAGGAQIGGTQVSDRNQFEGGTNGIDIVGINNTIQGNIFSFKPDLTPGVGSIWAIHIGLPLPGYPDPVAGNTIGGDDPGGLTPTICDGPCNMFANAGTQIFLNNSSVNEVDQTTIKGNFLGFDRTGNPVSGANGYAIDAQQSDDTVIGGTTAASANYIGGAGIGGVQNSFGGANGSISHNFFGLGPDGDTLHPNGITDVQVGAGGTTVEDNRFTSDGIEPTNAAVDVDASGAEVQGNVIGLGTANEDFGYNVPAIRVGGPFNLIGGDSPADYNTIEHGADTAIQVRDPAGSTEVRNNNFDDNDGMFIDLIPNIGPGNHPSFGANAGIQAPVVTATTTTSAQGTQDTGPVPVTVRVYSVTPGGAATFLSTTTGTGGTWAVSFPAVPATDCIAATQTVGFDGTSELSAALLADNTGTCDFTAPETTIGTGPAAELHDDGHHADLRLLGVPVVRCNLPVPLRHQGLAGLLRCS